MINLALRLRAIAFSAIVLASATCAVQAQTTAFTDPVGYFTIPIAGSSDNILSLPMVRDAAFAGTVSDAASTINASSFKALAGTSSPAWTTTPAGQWKYVAGTQALTYYVEFTSGQLKGLFYKIVDNDADTLTLDTEGDDLRAHFVNGVAGGLVAGDSFKIRPYWRIRDIFESAGSPVIEARTDSQVPKDDILVPDYTNVATNKPASAVFYYVNNASDGTGWRAEGNLTADRGDTILRPNDAFVLRRRNAASLTLTNLGGVQMIRTIGFVAGGDNNKANDTYISLNRPAAVTLNASGLHNANQNISVIKDSASPFNPGDRLLAFSTATGMNRPPDIIYYYLQGQGWRSFPDGTTDVGTTLLQPGVAYIVRKHKSNPGVDWVNDPNY